MIRTLSAIILLFISITGFAQKSRVDSVLFHETFESNSSTLSNWTKDNASSCSAYTWFYQANTGKGALGSDRYAFYNSSAAPKGCYSTLYTPRLQQPKQVDNNDSMIIDFYMKRFSTKSTDYISVSVYDENKGAVFGPFSAFADNTKSPATSDTGWYHFTWGVNYNDILNNNTTTGFIVGFTGVSAQGVDLQLDEVKISHISRQIVRKINFVTGFKGDTLKEKSMASINWTTQNVNTVDVSYSIDSGKTYSVLSSVSSSTPSYSWTVPALETTVGFLKLTDHDSTKLFTTSGPFIIQHNSGIAELSNKLNFSSFPNPVHNTLFVHFPDLISENTTLNLYDARGKLMLTRTVPSGTSETNLDVHNLVNGIYILEIGNSKSTSKQQLVVN